jgi:hypothetical protein
MMGAGELLSGYHIRRLRGRKSRRRAGGVEMEEMCRKCVMRIRKKKTECDTGRSIYINTVADPRFNHDSQ